MIPVEISMSLRDKSIPEPLITTLPVRPRIGDIIYLGDISYAELRKDFVTEFVNKLDNEKDRKFLCCKFKHDFYEDADMVHSCFINDFDFVYVIEVHIGTKSLHITVSDSEDDVEKALNNIKKHGYDKPFPFPF